MFTLIMAGGVLALLLLQKQPSGAPANQKQPSLPILPTGSDAALIAGQIPAYLLAMKTATFGGERSPLLINTQPDKLKKGMFVPLKQSSLQKTPGFDAAYPGLSEYMSPAGQPRATDPLDPLTGSLGKSWAADVGTLIRVPPQPTLQATSMLSGGAIPIPAPVAGGPSLDFNYVPTQGVTPASQTSPTCGVVPPMPLVGSPLGRISSPVVGTPAGVAPPVPSPSTTVNPTPPDSSGLYGADVNTGSYPIDIGSSGYGVAA